MEEILFNIACSLGKSQEQIREINLYREGDVTSIGQTLENCTVRDMWKQCQEGSEFTIRKQAVKEFNKENKLRKREKLSNTITTGGSTGTDFCGPAVMGQGFVTSEEIEVDSTGLMQNCSPLSYKVPNIRSIPRKFNVTILKNHDYKTIVYSSKGIGEPPFLLSLSVLMAIKDAVQSARSQVGLTGHFQLNCPATVQKIQAMCGNQLQAMMGTSQ
ncbi:XDH1-like protein [Mya arenaria]|uniref:XDH1-like protein n=1 Tax=Mya arenaria TaxID=6604 RepID=A0ABY7E8D5_MYAAR|nr:XDH1-like protein [Mya arenaria]